MIQRLRDWWCVAFGHRLGTVDYQREDGQIYWWARCNCCKNWVGVKS